MIEKGMSKILQEDLMLFLKLKKQIDKAKEKLEGWEEILFNAVKEGTKIEKGTYKAVVKENARRTVPWKDVVIELKGTSFVEQLIEETEPKITEKLEIRDSFTNKKVS